VYLIPFYAVDRELAFKEMRVVHLLAEREGLPVGSYGLFEYYCPDPDCDCRRVMLNVVEEDHPDRFLASISYAFDADDEMPGPFLDPMNPQSEYAEALLDLVAETVLIYQGYLDRLERHYALVKEAASDSAHPAYDELQELMDEGPEDVVRQRVTSQDDSVGRNDPCPCGSGRKYKHCCMRND
jgi:hypothetical protein